MEQILKNMANTLLVEFCLANNIDCSGTYCVKNGRGFTYSLRDDATGTVEIAAVTFHRSQVPTYRFQKPQPEAPTLVKIVASQSDADQIAVETSDAYSFNCYGTNRWKACCRMLAEMGCNTKEIEAIMRSKYTRWASFTSNSKYGKVSAADLERYLLNQKESVKQIAKDLLRGN